MTRETYRKMTGYFLQDEKKVQPGLFWQTGCLPELFL